MSYRTVRGVFGGGLSGDVRYYILEYWGQDGGAVICVLEAPESTYIAHFAVLKTRCPIANLFAKKVLMLYNENNSGGVRV